VTTIFDNMAQFKSWISQTKIRHKHVYLTALHSFFLSLDSRITCTLWTRISPLR